MSPMQVLEQALSCAGPGDATTEHIPAAGKAAAADATGPRQARG
eukprot:CAMPEP_0179264592 /NCGR_PEP_ID=MMETSP0797-20121207/28470_1 /TAXON_ID=47934 /ORGANISM="Dinophysis acuminata, Strain DAEP01" /LENGTH=43 /DNA_ID= /DNA_START= /DNA_END= /DNA_ORIENTATION=